MSCLIDPEYAVIGMIRDEQRGFRSSFLACNDIHVLEAIFGNPTSKQSQDPRMTFHSIGLMGSTTPEDAWKLHFARNPGRL